MTDLATNKIKEYDGAVWGDGWTQVANPGKTSPLHQCKEVFYDKDAAGTVNQALKFRFEWKVGFEGGTDTNAQSRGAWLNFWYPFPRLALSPVSGAPTRTLTIGEAYGGTTNPLGTFDTLNLEFASNGVRGWNKGLLSEDLGKVGALAMKLKLDLRTATGRVNIGFANMPFTFFAVDLFDRTFWHNFTIPKIGGWTTVIIPFGNRAPKNIYTNRLNETLDIFGWLPFGNLNLAQKEFTGITFDWRFVKMWGLFWKFPYDDANRYKNNIGEGAKNFIISMPMPW